MVRAELAPGELREHVGEICDAGKRASDLTRQLLMFSRRQMIAPRVLDLNEILTRMDRMLRRLLGEDVQLTSLQGANLGRVRVDAGSIEQVIMNLVVNARDAMPKGGKLSIETANIELDESFVTTHVDAKPGPHVLLAVSDDGQGMDKATQARIFEPFFTTKDQTKGTGLGLSTVFGIVRQAGGSIWVYSELGRGSTFKVYLPRVDSAQDTSPSVAPPSTRRGSETVLVVDDDAVVRGAACTILRRNGYRVLEAHDQDQAMQHCQTYPGTIHLLLTDVVMPNLSGPELAKRLTSLRPTMKVLCMSGYTDDSIVRHGVLEAEITFLQKPITTQNLPAKVREVLDVS